VSTRPGVGLLAIKGPKRGCRAAALFHRVVKTQTVGQRSRSIGEEKKDGGKKMSPSKIKGEVVWKRQLQVRVGGGELTRLRTNWAAGGKGGSEKSHRGGNSIADRIRFPKKNAAPQEKALAAGKRDEGEEGGHRRTRAQSTRKSG